VVVVVYCDVAMIGSSCTVREIPTFVRREGTIMVLEHRHKPWSE
jgi:hypothetical protein